MIDFRTQTGLIATRLVYLLAWCSSLALLVVLRLENAPVYVAVLAVISFLCWYGAYHLATGNAPGSELPVPDSAHDPDYDQSGSVDRYFTHLIDNLQKNWMLCDTDLDHAQSTLRNVHHALQEAIETAKSTGMLALNSMASAANTGEVGRGFVTVSRDLVAISAQSGQDLEKMREIIARTTQRLLRTRRIMSAPMVNCLEQDGGSSISELVVSIANIQGAQEELRVIAERYQRNNKSDVRWMQLGDAVRRLLNEVINVLYQFELRLTDVISDMRLARLSGTLSENQLLEIKGRFSSDRGAEGMI
ncbi:MAG: methyl-accepting chemotaxis protein [Pseudomonadota bacterium]|nr:methyl-accepting chemotaxis protein [Pseudomonadota bacterium]